MGATTVFWGQNASSFIRGKVHCPSSGIYDEILQDENIRKIEI
jgi:hypothetical protein